jgi:hypothetical protein
MLLGVHVNGASTSELVHVGVMVLQFDGGLS